MVFEQSISGLIKALRAVRNDARGEERVIAQATEEIAREVKGTDLDIKSDAVMKGIYLDMLGYPTLHSHPFPIIELMSSPLPQHKQTGYLAACQSFTPSTGPLLLAANLLQKDLSSVPTGSSAGFGENSRGGGLGMGVGGGKRSDGGIVDAASRSTAHFHTVLSNLPPLLGLPPLSPIQLGLSIPPPSGGGGALSPLSPLLSHSSLSIRRLTILVLHAILEKGYENRFAAEVSEEGRIGTSVGVEREKPPIGLFKQLLTSGDTGILSATMSLVTELILDAAMLAKHSPAIGTRGTINGYSSIDEGGGLGYAGYAAGLAMNEGQKLLTEYLELAPELFGVLTESKNNWVLIKVVKAFTPLPYSEPRLYRKLLPPFSSLINTTQATSLCFECVRGCIQSGLLGAAEILNSGVSQRETQGLAELCVEKLGEFLDDGDQNLRHVSLTTLTSLLPTQHSHLLSFHHSQILSLIDDPDISIRMPALDLIEGMVDRDNVTEIVRKLMGHLFLPTGTAATGSNNNGSEGGSVGTHGRKTAAEMLAKAQAGSGKDAVPSPTTIGDGTSTTTTPLQLSPSYRSTLMSLIIRITSANTYANVTNFHWYIDVLIDLAYLSLSLSSLSGSARPMPGMESFNNSKGGNGVNVSGGEEENVGAKIKRHLIDVTARVKACRPYAVKKMERLLDDETFLENSAIDEAEQAGRDNSNFGEPSSGNGEETTEGAQVWEAAVWICGEYCRESTTFPSSTRSLVITIFRASVSQLPSKTLPMVIHNGLKIFARWTEGVVENWNERREWVVGGEEELETRAVIDLIDERLREWKGRGDVELEERASEYISLLSLVRSGLSTPGRRSMPAPSQADTSTLSSSSSYPDIPPSPFSTDDFSSSNPFAEDQSSSSSTSAQRQQEQRQEMITIEGGPPNSLSLLAPMFSSHDLPPVNPKAQGMVALPDGLDLESWWGGSTSANILSVTENDLEGEDQGVEVDGYGRVIIRDGGRSETGGMKNKKGIHGGKGKGKTKGKGKGKGKDLVENVVDMTEEEEEELDRTRREEEEREEMEKVAKAREERLRRQAEDPYYIGGGKKKKKATATTAISYDDDEDDIDAIPIVQVSLDELNLSSPPSTTTTAATTKSRQTPTSTPRPPPRPEPQITFEIDREGELPPGVTIPPPKVSQTPLGGSASVSRTASGAGTPNGDGTPEERERDVVDVKGVVKRKVVKKKKGETASGTGEKKKKKSVKRPMET